jgi:hypothetical protein
MGHGPILCDCAGHSLVAQFAPPDSRLPLFSKKKKAKTPSPISPTASPLPRQAATVPAVHDGLPDCMGTCCRRPSRGDPDPTPHALADVGRACAPHPAASSPATPSSAICMHSTPSTPRPRIPHHLRRVGSPHPSTPTIRAITGGRSR